MKIKSNVVKQEDVCFIEVSSKTGRTKKAHAFIVNQKDIPDNTYKKIFEFEVVAVVRPQAGGYDNLHVQTGKNSNYFSLMGTGYGNISKFSELEKSDYIPFLVKLIREI